MGWLTPTDARSPSSQSSTRQQDTNYTAPDRSARALCWEARDFFFKCLDEHKIIDSIQHEAEAKRACGKALAVFERDCVDSWVTYFKKRRVMEHQREMTLKRLESEGAKTIAT